MKVEDYLEILTNLQSTDAKFELESPDRSILFSIGRQVVRGIALTDRQYDLVKTKLLDYEYQFKANNIELDKTFPLRQPLRQIDRSKYIKICKQGEEIPLKGIDQDLDWIKIRFPFSKKLILALDPVISLDRQSHYHQKGSHEHFFQFKEKIVYALVRVFKNKNFEIDQELLKYYEELETMVNNKDNHIPGVYSFKLDNLNSNAINYIISDIGEPNLKNLAIYKDRSELYGLKHFDEKDLEESLSKLTELSYKIVNRKSSNILVNTNEYNLKDLIASILELNRMPMLVCINESTAYDDVKLFNETLSGIFFQDDCCAVFRLDNDTDKNKQFNQYVKENNLNNSLALSTKVVYTNKKLIPKPVVASDWKPRVIVFLGNEGISNGPSKALIDECDLVVYFADDASLMQTYSRSPTRIQKI